MGGRLRIERWTTVLAFVVGTLTSCGKSPAGPKKTAQTSGATNDSAASPDPGPDAAVPVPQTAAPAAIPVIATVILDENEDVPKRTLVLDVDGKQIGELAGSLVRDAAGRIIETRSVGVPGGAVVEDITWTFDAAGLPTSRSNSLLEVGLMSESFTYDSLGRVLTRLNIADGNSAKGTVETMIYDLKGRLSSVTRKGVIGEAQDTTLYDWDAFTITTLPPGGGAATSVARYRYFGPSDRPITRQIYEPEPSPRVLLHEEC
jgi:hypothetical protein